METPSKKAQKKQSKKGKPRSYGKRKARIAYYYEMIYPLRKLRRIWNHTGSVAALRAWADAYKTPTGASGAGALVRLTKEKGIKLQVA